MSTSPVTLTPPSHRLLFVGTNNYNAGYQAGLAVAKLLGDKARVGISRIPGLDSINHRVAGFTDALKKAAPGALIVTEVNDEGDLQKAEPVNTAMPQAHPEINVVFCGHGNPATGALAATRNVGRDKDGPNKVYVVAWAIDVPILQGVENGDYGMTVAQNPYMMGVQSMLELWSAAHPTQFDSMTNPGLGQVPTSDLDTGVKICEGRPGDQGVDDAAKTVTPVAMRARFVPARARAERHVRSERRARSDVSLPPRRSTWRSTWTADLGGWRSLG